MTPSDSAVSDSAVADRYRSSLEFVFGRLNFERTPDAAGSLLDFKLVRMEELLAALGNPQRKVPTVHIAGSKGKGSTATMVASIAEAAGHQAGLFTSPHVDQFEERFTINGKTATAEQVTALVDRVRPVVERMDREYTGQGVTFFEVVTALGWLHFEDNQVDLAVMEVGLGGRLDSTNVCNPLVTAITSISRDHTRLLGETLGAIAREKAGIIKPGIPVVTAVIAEEPAAAIAGIAAQHAAPLYRLGNEFQCAPRVGEASAFQAPVCFQMDFQSEFGRLTDLTLAMPGEHQTRNAAVAVMVAQLLNRQGLVLSDSQIREGLKRACCPLRIEVMDRAPLTIVDAAHNAASIAALCETLKPVSARRRHVLFATSRDKEIESLLTILNEHFDQFWLTRYTNNPRAVPLQEFETLAPRILTKPWVILPDTCAALQAIAEQATPEDLVCVTGSFFLAAEAKHLLAGGLNSLKNSLTSADSEPEA